MKNTVLKEEKFLKERIELNGSRYLIGNGFMGYRGTLDEFRASQLTACNMAGLFDKNGDLWRESVNAPNIFYTTLFVNGEEISTLSSEPAEHMQALDISCGLHSRKTVFSASGVRLTFCSERFLSMADENICAVKVTVTADSDVSVTVKTGIDADIWSINGNHLDLLNSSNEDGITELSYLTVQNKIPLKVFEKTDGFKFTGEENGIYINEKTVNLKANEPFVFTKTGGVYWGDGAESAKERFEKSALKDYDALLCEHKAVWNEIWNNSDVIIEGDDEAQFAMRYSIYHLSSIVPRHTDRCGIPARGLSGQVYKGASFWDTEMFMQPFFSFTDPALSKNLTRYRINTIGGAERKAAEYGYDGAFYAWESQETGDDACTLFNITDVFTKRPLRTYFRDKQIHVSADMVYGLWEYLRVTGDWQLLLSGGIELIYECVLFFYTYSYFKVTKNRYELLDVVGPDEYHERVNNNAFTNRMVKYSADTLLKALDKVKELDKAKYDEFVSANDISWVSDFAQKLYVPAPDKNGIIEQFDGYMKLEDIGLDEIKKRVIIPNEYWGCGHGLATTTRILKQADIVMMLNVFRAEYEESIKKANWEFYEPYTEHGSSLSACAYAIVAAEIGYTDWAYKYFMKTVTVDLTGATRQYLGSLYIGGTHPAANGGSWNTAVFGFGGVSYTDDALDISPRLPENWSALEFKLLYRGVRLTVRADKNKTTVVSEGNTDGINIMVNKIPYKFN